MKVAIDKMLVNRSPITRAYGVCGSPVLQMYTHNPFLSDCAENHKIESRFGRLPYNSIQEASTGGGGYGYYGKLRKLVDSIASSGVTEPLTGWSLDGDSIFELHGGHHRAVIAHALGYRILEVVPKAFDRLSTLLPNQIDPIRKTYYHVYEKENLSPGRSYNPFPGLKAIRPSAEGRLHKVYRSIIECKGNRLLDLGCNDGYFGVNLSCHDFDVTFVDRSVPYLSVVIEKMRAIGNKGIYLDYDIDQYLKTEKGKFDVVVYLDVFYHTVLEKGISIAYDHLRSIVDKTEECLLFSPGRWDKMESAGCPQKDVFDILKAKAKKIRFLGKDNDPGYQRELYAIYY